MMNDLEKEFLSIIDKVIKSEGLDYDVLRYGSARLYAFYEFCRDNKSIEKMYKVKIID